MESGTARSTRWASALGTKEVSGRRSGPNNEGHEDAGTKASWLEESVGLVPGSLVTRDLWVKKPTREGAGGGRRARL